MAAPRCGWRVFLWASPEEQEGPDPARLFALLTFHEFQRKRPGICWKLISQRIPAFHQSVRREEGGSNVLLAEPSISSCLDAPGRANAEQTAQFAAAVGRSSS